MIYDLMIKELMMHELMISVILICYSVQVYMRWPGPKSLVY